MGRSDNVKRSQFQFTVGLWLNILQANFDIAQKASFLYNGVTGLPSLRAVTLSHLSLETDEFINSRHQF